MTHAVQHTRQDDSGAAFTQACRYPDGTNVLCATVIELADGLIVHQTVVQVWDESDAEDVDHAHRCQPAHRRSTRPSSTSSWAASSATSAPRCRAALVVIGDRLGLYRAMGDGEPVSPEELAQRTGTDARYVREWLSNQAAGGYVSYDPGGERSSLTPEQAFALAQEGSPRSCPARSSSRPR